MALCPSRVGVWVALEAFLFCIGSQIFDGASGERDELFFLLPKQTAQSTAAPGEGAACISCFKEQVSSDLAVQITQGSNGTICHSECKIIKGRIC